MRTAALISNPFRAQYCAAFLAADAGPHHTILTADPRAFEEADLDEKVRILKVTPPPELLPATKLARTRWYRRGLNRLRAGSRFGSWLERTIKRIIWRLRYLDRIVALTRPRTPPPLSESEIRRSSMYERLTVEHASNPITRIVVFDVFDLPVGLRFAEDHSMEVLVR